MSLFTSYCQIVGTLPDPTQKLSADNKRSPINSKVAIRRGEVLHPRQTSCQLAQIIGQRLRLARVQEHLQRLQTLALPRSLGILYSRHDRFDILPTQHHSRVGLHVSLSLVHGHIVNVFAYFPFAQFNRRSAAAEPATCDLLMSTGHLLWLASKHSDRSTASNSALLHDRNRGLLCGRIHIPECRWRLRSDSSCRRFLYGLVRVAARFYSEWKLIFNTGTS